MAGCISLDPHWTRLMEPVTPDPRPASATCIRCGSDKDMGGKCTNGCDR